MDTRVLIVGAGPTGLALAGELMRRKVDCILIDPQYDGQVFNVALADVPERKQDLVNGRYELPAPPVGSNVAVKIIDMLGEELVLTATVR